VTHLDILLEMYHDGTLYAEHRLSVEATDRDMWAWIDSIAPKAARGGVVTARRADGRKPPRVVAISRHHPNGPIWARSYKVV
jgi:hypothetical protein